MTTKKKCRQYLEEYLSYGFIENPFDKRHPMCLICSSSFSNEAMKPSRLIQHLQKKHPDQMYQPVDYFEHLKMKFNQRNTVPSFFKKCSETSENMMIASYEIAQIIAKTGSSYSVAENLIQPAFEILVKTILHQDSANILKALPLNIDSIQKRIDEMSSDIENQLIKKLKNRKFSILLDEFTISENRSILLTYVRFIDDDYKLCEEMLFLKLLETDITGPTIFTTMLSWFKEKQVPFENLVSCATDGDPSMVGINEGFIYYLKKCPSILTVHCIMHRYYLISKNISPDLHESLMLVITTVNKIKSNSKYDHLFIKFCIGCDEEHINLILHTEDRWLSKGNCLARFANLFDTIINYLKSTGDKDLAEKISNHKCNINFLAWIFQKLNEVSLQLQNKLYTLLDCKRVLKAFTEKLLFFQFNIQKKNFNSMPELIENLEDLTDETQKIYTDYLLKLKEEINSRFLDLLSFKVQPWMIDPFGCDVETVSVNIQEELIELKCNDECKYKFEKGGMTELWLSKTTKQLYPLMWSEITKVLLCFPTQYLVECGFNAVNRILRKEIYTTDLNFEGSIRLKLSNIIPNIKSLTAKHQTQVALNEQVTAESLITGFCKAES